MKGPNFSVVHENGGTVLRFSDLQAHHIIPSRKIYVLDFTGHLVLVEGEKAADVCCAVWNRKVDLIVRGSGGLSRIRVVSRDRWHIDGTYQSCFGEPVKGAKKVPANTAPKRVAKKKTVKPASVDA